MSWSSVLVVVGGYASRHGSPGTVASVRVCKGRSWRQFNFDKAHTPISALMAQSLISALATHVTELKLCDQQQISERMRGEWERKYGFWSCNDLTGRKKMDWDFKKNHSRSSNHKIHGSAMLIVILFSTTKNNINNIITKPTVIVGNCKSSITSNI